MNKVILFFAGLFACIITSLGQSTSEKMLFIIDSIPLINNPEDWNMITNDDIADITVVRDRDSLKELGWAQLNGITYIFTKAYRSRPDSLKRIPSLKQMEDKDGTWYLKGSPYSGKYIDYYNNGSIQNKGTLVNSKLNGELTVYFKSGTVRSVSDYKNGVLHGLTREYYKNGALMQRIGYSEGRSNGLFEHYFINGQIENEKKSKKDTHYDTIITYYSTGKIKHIRLIRNGEPIRDKNENDLSYYNTKFLQSWNAEDVNEMKKNFFHIWLLDSTSTDTHFIEGVLLAKEFYFDAAIAAFDKVLELEPLDRNALLQRGLARLKKYQILRSAAFLKDKKDIPLTLEDLLSMPGDEQVKVFDDLKLADDVDHTDYFVKKAVPEAILNYCRSKSSR